MFPFIPLVGRLQTTHQCPRRTAKLLPHCTLVVILPSAVSTRSPAYWPHRLIFGHALDVGPGLAAVKPLLKIPPIPLLGKPRTLPSPLPLSLGTPPEPEPV